MEILLVLVVVGLGAATVASAPGPYLVVSAVARVLVAVGVAPELVYPTLAVTAIIDGYLLWSFFHATAAEGRDTTTEAATGREEHGAANARIAPARAAMYRRPHALSGCRPRPPLLDRPG